MRAQRKITSLVAATVGLSLVAAACATTPGGGTPAPSEFDVNLATLKALPAPPVLEELHRAAELPDPNPPIDPTQGTVIDVEGELVAAVTDLVSPSTVSLAAPIFGGRDELRLRVGDQSYRLDAPTLGGDLHPGDKLSVHGLLDGGGTLHADRVALSSRGSLEKSLRSLSTKRILVVPLHFSGGTNQGIVPWLINYGAGYSQNFSIKQFWERNSYGAVTTTSAGINPVQIPHVGAPQSAGDCDPASVITRGRAAAVAAGQNLSNYDHVVFSFEDDSPGGCWNWTFMYGWGQVGGDIVMSEDWLWSFMTATSNAPPVTGLDLAWGIVDHELGHTEGLMHANLLNCTHPTAGAVAMIGSCTSQEYGNPLNNMAQLGDFGARDRWWKGWLSPSQMFSAAATTATSGSFTLTPIEDNSAGLKAARISVFGKEYWFEYRQPISLDAFADNTRPAVFDGVIVSTERPIPGYPAGTNAFDMHPLTVDDGSAAGEVGSYDLALALDQSVVTREGAKFTVTAIGANGITVNYSTPASQVFAAPSAPTVAPTVLTTSGGFWITNAGTAAWGSETPGWWRVHYHSTDNVVDGTTVVGSDGLVLVGPVIPPGRNYRFDLTPINGVGLVGTAGPPSNVVLSYDNPRGPVGGVTVTETNGAQTLSIPLTLPRASASALTRGVTTQNGTAVAGSDFTALNTTTTFPAGATTGTVNVTILGDTVHEGTETFTVRLPDPSNTWPIPMPVTVVTVTVLDND